MSERRTSDVGRLIRLGLHDPDRARRLCESERVAPLLADGEDDVLTDIGAAADPDAALLLLVRMLEACDEQEWRRLTATMLADPDMRRRLIEVVGMSEALGEFLIRHPSEWTALADAESLSVAPSARELHDGMLAAVGADPQVPQPVAAGSGTEVLDALRVQYRRELLEIGRAHV